MDVKWRGAAVRLALEPADILAAGSVEVGATGIQGESCGLRLGGATAGVQRAAVMRLVTGVDDLHAFAFNRGDLSPL